MCMCACVCPTKEGLITGHLDSLMGTLHLCSLCSQRQDRELICPALVTKRNLLLWGRYLTWPIRGFASEPAPVNIVPRCPRVPGVTIHFLGEFTAVSPSAGVPSLQGLRNHCLENSMPMGPFQFRGD